MFLTVDEFIERIGAAEADNIAGQGPRDARTLDRAAIDAALMLAEGFVRGYVRARYRTPFEPAPELLKGAAADIAVYRLRLKTGNQSGVSEQVQKRYDDALRLLRDVQAGKVALDLHQIGGDEPAREAPIHISGRPSRAQEVLDSFALVCETGQRRRP